MEFEIYHESLGICDFVFNDLPHFHLFLYVWDVEASKYL